MYVISRFQHGVTLNPKEFILDEKNEVMKFESYDSAKQFLLEHDVPEDVIGDGIYIDDENEL